MVNYVVGLFNKLLTGAYCTVKNLTSFRVRSVVQENIHEIHITSEDVGAYGKDIGCNIVQLLNAILPELAENVSQLLISIIT